MTYFNNFSDLEEVYTSIFPYYDLDATENSIIEEEYLLNEKYKNFNLETDIKYKEVFEKTNIFHNENGETNEQTNKNCLSGNKNISLLQKKRGRNDDEIDLMDETIKENFEEKEEDFNIQLDSKEIIFNKFGKHNIYCEDNIINKLKGHFFNGFIIDLVKKNSNKKNIILKKLPHKTFIADLNKKKNEGLFLMKMSDILRQEKISSKYSNYDTYENRKIIDRIYEEKKEINVIKILNLTFEELFIIFRRKLNISKDIRKIEEIKDKIKGLDLFENDAKYQDIEHLIEEDIEKRYIEPSYYIKKVKSLCCNYEQWFTNKIGRISRKKMSAY